jgi:GGDEF domain-containing protein
MHLPDRPSFDAALAAALAHADERRRPLGMVMVQWVGPGSMRDLAQAGEASGCAVDESAAVSAIDAISAVCGGRGDVHRIADDRLAIVLPNFDLGEATAVAERCLRAFRVNALETGATLFVAAAAYPEPAPTGEALVADAERMLHQVRRAAIDASEARTAATAGAGAYPVDGSSTSSTFTGAQLEHMRLSYVQHRVITCPNDGTFLRAQEVHEIGRGRATLIVRCPRCGMQARL